MASVTNFIRNTPLASLRDYFTAAGIEFPTPVNWDAPEPEVVRPLLQAVDQMDDEARGRVINDGERVGAMADVAGQTALYSVVDDREVLDELENGHARAMWLFINDLNLFRHAEEVRFTDERRRGRSWDGFMCEANLNLRRDEIALNAFKAALCQRFASRNVHVDIFERVRPTFEGEDCDLVQITVYREGLPDDQFAFDEGELVRRAYRPVFEAAMTYEPASGVIEVVANDRESRAEMAQYLARDLLGVEFRDEKVPMRRYDLAVLLAPHAFPTDIEDGIERVEVRQLRLMPIDAVGERVTLEAMSKAERDIWAMAEARLGPDNPLTGGWVGGFNYVNRLSLVTLQATGMGFFGLYGSTTALATTLTLSAVVNCIGIGFQRGTHANWQLVQNDASGAPTLTDLGASFPVASTTNVLTLTLLAAPNSSEIGVRVVEEVSGAVVEVILNSDIPAATQLLSPRNFMNNGATAAAVAYDCSGVYVETDY